MRTGICIPVCDPGPEFERILQVLRETEIAPVLILDSSREPAVISRPPPGWQIIRVAAEEFDHGGTRRRAVDLMPAVEIVLFLTQDAVPESAGSLKRLISCFDDRRVGAAFGRQVPRRGAGAIEAHARLFNYPPCSRNKSEEDICDLGIKTAFISNSFAAYRRPALEAIGGFPRRCIVSEDTHTASRLLLAGWSIAYCAEAGVYHSHGYTPGQELQRYFDLGVFHSREPWIRRVMGRAEGEGARFVTSELRYLVKHAPSNIPSALVRTPLRYLGFRLGLLEKWLPRAARRRLSLQKRFWEAEAKADAGPERVSGAEARTGRPLC